MTPPRIGSFGLNKRYTGVAGFLLGIIWLWVAFDRPYSLPSHISWNPYSNTFESDRRKDVFNFEPIDSKAIRDVCSTTEWNSSLVFTCDNNEGGVGHVRNSILNCVRFAISAGAALVLPNIVLREMEDQNVMEMDLGKRHGLGRKTMDYMFDVGHFVESLHLSCPDMLLLKNLDQYASERRKGLLPEDLVNNHPTSGLERPELWRGEFYDWVEEHIANQTSNPLLENEPIIVDLEQSFLTYPTNSDGHGFAHDFGKILKFRQDARILATAILIELEEYHDMDGNISEPIMNPSFFGAHLRLENEDAHLDRRHVAPAPYMFYEGQATAYLEHATASRMSLMYASSGNLSDVERLVEQGREVGIDVTHKHALLKDKHRDHLETLNWDQRALVDFLVLTKSQEFGGVGHSAFSWNVALKRQHLAKEMGLGREGRNGKVLGTGLLNNDRWGDGISMLYGVRKGYVESSECLWE